MGTTPDGGAAPTTTQNGLKLPGAGAGGAISLGDPGGRTVSLGMPGKLPKPTLSDATATYAGIAPGVDMKIQALRSGFEQSFVINYRSAVSTSGLSWSLPLKTKGLDVRQESDGSVSFVDNKGVVRSRIPAALAWDSRVGTPQESPASYSKVSLQVVVKNPGQATLVITPDASWLNDPSTVFPVTVDPTYLMSSLNPVWDTYIQQGFTTNFASSTVLKVGSASANANTRSFINFDLSSLKGKYVIGANLKLRNSLSGTCSAREWDAYYMTGTAGPSWGWGNQNYWGSMQASSTQTLGASGSCPADWVAIDTTTLVQNMLNDSQSINTIGLRAANETDATYVKQFDSMETTNDPVLNVQYDRYPNGPSVASLASPSVSYPNGDVYTATSTPALAASATDPDSNSVQVDIQVHNSTAFNSGSLVAECQSGFVASAASASCQPSPALPDGTYYVRSKASDSMQWGPWTGTYTFKVAATQPAVPVISCPGYANGTWATTAPGSAVSCTISAAGSGTSAPNAVLYTVDGGSQQTATISPSSDPNVAKATISVPNTAGAHSVLAQAQSPSGVKSSQSPSYGFGYGTVAMNSPSASAVTQTTSTVAIQASAPAPPSGGQATAELRWRLPNGGDANTGWNDATSLTVANNPGTGGVSISGTWDTTTATRDAAAGINLDPRVPTTLELQVCVTYPGTSYCTWTNQQVRTIRLPHAFGNGFPTTHAGPGEVALWTGEFTTTATDVTVPGYNGTLSLSRTHSTFAGPVDPAESVFGPGWTASLDGTAGSGLAGDQLVDNTQTDGTLALVDAQGTPMVFAPAGGPVRRTGGNLTTGSWTAVDPDTIAAGVSATVSGTGSSTVVAVTEADGTATTFHATTAPGTGVAGVFAPVSVAQPGSGTTTYTLDGSGRVTRILAPIPTGMTASNCPATGTLAPGCRALDINYATTTTATSTASGDFAGQVSSINLRIYNPTKSGGAGMDSIPVAAYKYDNTGRLVTETDPRTNLSTSYGYDSGNRLTMLTPPGQAPYTINYAGSPTKFANLTRPNPASAGGGTATLTSVVYNVPTSGSGLPDLSAGTVGKWDQAAAPTHAYAVFGQNHPVSSIDPSQIGSSNWVYAQIQATDDKGFTVNAATYGAGDWQRSAIDYDASTQQVIKTISPTDIDQVLTYGADPNTVGTITQYNTATNGPASTPSGSVITDVWLPSRPVALANGTTVSARPHTHTTYDQGSPDNGVNPTTNQGWELPTSVTQTVSSPLISNGDLTDTAHITKTGYGNTEASWELGLPTSNTQVVDGGSGDITKSTGYDSEGRVISQSQPMSNGSDAGTRDTVYYTVAANSGVPQCGGHPEWAGSVCETYFAAQANGHDQVTTTDSAYNTYLVPSTVIETANGATRTRSISFDSAGRPITSRTTASGLTGSTPVNGTGIDYDPSTGLAVRVWALNSSGGHIGDPITTGYDSWGRTIGYSPSSVVTTTTTYNSAGQVSSIADTAGTKSFGYGTDANGNAENRGMPTSETITGGPGGNIAFAGAYDRSGALVVQKLPAGVTQKVQTDPAEQVVGMTYSGQVTTVNPDNSTSVNPNGPWLGWTLTRDSLGRITRENTPAAGGYVTGGIDPTKTLAAAPFDRSYSYDLAGRLSQVQDRTAAAGAGVNSSTGEPNGAGCVTRSYAFDKNGNRLSLATAPAASDGTCQTSSGTSTRTWGWDAGDRTTNSGYVFDAFGRQTTLPAADAPQSGGGNITLGYYDTDAVASISQGSSSTTFTLDQSQRRSIQTETAGSVVTTTARTYDDTSDNPAYVDVTNGGATTRTRYATSLGGDLGLTITSSGSTSAQITLADPNGDVVATADVTSNTTPAVGISGWSDQDEYGNPLENTPSAITAGIGYGWAGTSQRATVDSGLMLMGARIYNPSTGGFTSTDPVYGGNHTTYAYPSDPVNRGDLSGAAGSWHTYYKSYYFYYKQTNGIAGYFGYTHWTENLMNGIVAKVLAKDPFATFAYYGNWVNTTYYWQWRWANKVHGPQQYRIMADTIVYTYARLLFWSGGPGWWVYVGTVEDYHQDGDIW
ncbi:DNRLRE domain-containing protein [Nocardioides baekrokdamisoli]|uniref:DNRLRE domain-containing protein n=1 Tax=Nocardioides baekrokdamisoli TaxID=1804624 RepID=UPI0013DE0CAE|nr:DNRLRE domain-containing protein [Nocardioides baekrokdamisoli]